LTETLKDPVLIVGAGPAGLGAAYKLNQAGFNDWAIYERQRDVGGLSASFVDEHGFTWDIGGHVVFSHYDLFTKLLDDLIEPSGWIEHERESWIHILDDWVPYPFQNNIHRLPAGECADCLKGLLEAAGARGRAPFESFDDFIERTFGDGIARLFMRPYNEKSWAYPPSDMDAGWIADRVSVPDAERVKRNVELKRDDCGWGPNNTFRFPVHGGTGAIWKALADRLPAERIFTGLAAVELDVEAHTITLADGQVQDYGTLISTMPINKLAQISGVEGWIEATSKLKSSMVNVVGLGLVGGPPPALKTKCWMYFPEPKYPFYRVTHFSRYSPNNVPEISNQWSLMCEVSESRAKPVNPATLVEEVVAGLTETGLITGSGAVSHTWTGRAKHARPTPTRGRDDILGTVLPDMYENRILSRGRFGGWRYEVGNMDHSFMQGYEAADHIINGTPEVTLFKPDQVNR
jgi:protoporphyrinogen oxidase